MKILIFLPFSIKLGKGDTSHGGVSGHQRVVDWNDLGGITSPGEASEEHSELLEGRYSFNRDEDVSNISENDEPLDSGAVEVD